MAFAEKRATGWIGRYRDADGKKRTLPGTYRRKADAIRAAGEEEAKSRRQGWIDPKGGATTWGQWCDVWWPTRTASAAVVRSDASTRDRHLKPRWSRTPLDKITRFTVTAWTKELSDKGLAPTSIARYLSLFSTSLNAAVSAGLIAKNPAEGLRVTAPRVTLERYLTRDEYEAIRSELNSHDQEVADFLVSTGARWGEMAGLHWSRVDQTRGMIRIADTWVQRTRSMSPYPKGRQDREVPLLPWVDLPDKEAAFTCGFKHDRGSCTGQLVFRGPLGGVMDSAAWSKRVWAPAVERAKVGHVRIHDLRHTYASWLLQAGVGIAEVSRLLGHQDIKTTMRYAHLAEPNRDVVAAAIPALGGHAVGKLTQTGTRIRLVNGS